MLKVSSPMGVNLCQLFVRYGTLRDTISDIHDRRGILMPASRPRSIRKSRKNFNLKTFLAQAGIGRTACVYGPKQAVFSQGESGDAVFYFQEGRVESA